MTLEKARWVRLRSTGNRSRSSLRWVTICGHHETGWSRKTHALYTLGMHHETPKSPQGKQKKIALRHNLMFLGGKKIKIHNKLFLILKFKFFFSLISIPIITCDGHWFFFPKDQNWITARHFIRIFFYVLKSIIR